MPCRVKGCNESHASHYCRICRNSNSEHFSSNCPFQGNQTPQPRHDSTQPLQPQIFDVSVHCRVAGCRENHPKHYCRQCKATDADHFSSNCSSQAPGGQMLPQPPPSSSNPPHGQAFQENTHQGIMVCKCGHQQGNLNFPLPNNLYHLNGTCLWECCKQNWGTTVCTAVKDSQPLVSQVANSCQLQAPSSNTGIDYNASNSTQPDHFKKSPAVIPVFTRTRSNSVGSHCRAKGCTQDHQTHYCHKCQEKDADHRSSDCTKSHFKMLHSQSFAVKSCQVTGCTDLHTAHYCKFCNNQDSDHFSIDCPMKPAPTPNLHCKVPDCMEQHEAHFCWICKKNDSDHRSQECPKRHETILYHGTKKENAVGIAATGLRASRGGTLGPGVYFVTTCAYAKAIALHQAKKENSNPTEVAIIKAKCDLGKVYTCPLDLKNERGGKFIQNYSSWQDTHDSCAHKHAPWAVKKDFREICIKDASKVHVEDCSIVPA